MNHNIQSKVRTLLGRMHSKPQFSTQGAVLFVDLENQKTRRAYLSRDVFNHFLGGRGANMFLLYNLMQEGMDPLNPEIPLIFGAGTLTGAVSCATRGNVTSISPDSYAILDANAGDYFPAFMKRHGYDHIVLYGRPETWQLLRIHQEKVSFADATPYLGMDNIDFTAAIERDLKLKERKDLAMARITSAGENLVLSSGIMGGPKSIWARGGAGAKMGSLKLKAILLEGKVKTLEVNEQVKESNKKIRKKLLSTSVISNALKTVGTPFLYKPSRVLGALGTKNNQETSWFDSLDADNFDPYRPGMDGCYKCPVRCRARNDMTPAGKGGWGAHALKGIQGNASYDPSQAEKDHEKTRTYRGIQGDDVFDRYDKGDGPEYVTLGKFGPNIGIQIPEQVLRLNNILNDLGLDSSGTGGAIAWAMELFQRGIITESETGGLNLSWGNYPVVEKLLRMTAGREGFGDTIADSARAVERKKYPEQALGYRMAVKGLFQSDPHDARILKAIALGLAVATRGMDHLRNRPTLEINARINDAPGLKSLLYKGKVAAEPNSYEGKEYAVRRCEDIYAVGDSVGMCRFDTMLFNSPNLVGPVEFTELLHLMTGLPLSETEIEKAGQNIMGLERMLNYRLGLRAEDDTLPQRWFEEGNSAGPFKGEKIDRQKFDALKKRYYQISGLTPQGLPVPDWHQKLSEVATGFAIQVTLPPGFMDDGEQVLTIDEPVDNLSDLWPLLKRKLPESITKLDDTTLNFSVNDQLVLHSEMQVKLKSGDQLMLLPAIGGG
ncbi:MAG: aldehyde ferredoxin oxidoreductase [Deltaproteobacteria bacterium]|nr:aldehyde ferredoxin oxidoreductase [Deltaproteobacteria bacterium]MBT7154727.1 aldehyde ferredoxin oxidoreductase [Deltaproteobacteria bacterium]